MSPKREWLHQLVDKLRKERVGGLIDAPELVAAEVMVDLLERERRIAERYTRGHGVTPQDDWIGRAGLKAGADLSWLPVAVASGPWEH